MKRILTALLLTTACAFSQVIPPIVYDIEANFQQEQELTDQNFVQGAGVVLRYRLRSNGRYLDLAGLGARWDARESVTNTSSYQKVATVVTSTTPNYFQIELDSDQTGTAITNWVYSFIVTSGGIDYPIGRGDLDITASSWTGASAIMTNITASTYADNAVATHAAVAATTNSLGHIIVGSGLSVTGDGTLSADSTTVSLQDAADNGTSITQDVTIAGSSFTNVSAKALSALQPADTNGWTTSTHTNFVEKTGDTMSGDLDITGQLDVSTAISINGKPNNSGASSTITQITDVGSTNGESNTVAMTYDNNNDVLDITSGVDITGTMTATDSTTTGDHTVTSNLTAGTLQVDGAATVGSLTTAGNITSEGAFLGAIGSGSDYDTIRGSYLELYGPGGVRVLNSYSANTSVFKFDRLGVINSYSTGTGTTQPIQMQIDSSTAVTIATNLNVGIGDTTPDAKLDVAGTLQVDGAATVGGTLTATNYAGFTTATTLTYTETQTVGWAEMDVYYAPTTNTVFEFAVSPVDSKVRRVSLVVDNDSGGSRTYPSNNIAHFSWFESETVPTELTNSLVTIQLYSAPTSSNVTGWVVHYE